LDEFPEMSGSELTKVHEITHELGGLALVVDVVYPILWSSEVVVVKLVCEVYVVTVEEVYVVSFWTERVPCPRTEYSVETHAISLEVSGEFALVWLELVAAVSISRYRIDELTNQFITTLPSNRVALEG
jgi:hypothetical protein